MSQPADPLVPALEAAASGRPSEAAGAADAAPCVYYDGGCPLCRAEIRSYQATEGGDRLRWVDAQACAPAELGPDLARGDALARLHVRRADGTLVQGAAAFVEVWAALPRWAPLARLARLPGALPLLEAGYRGFLRLRRAWRPAPHPADRLPRALRQDLRTDQAGETGAVMIYRGVLAVARDPAVRRFAEHHLDTERRHLALIDERLPPRGRSRLLPAWRVAGWLTGALPALAGPRAVYATIAAVETFVDRHYAEQVAWIDAALAGQADGGVTIAGRPGGAAVITDAALRDDLQALRTLLEQCRLDEVAHRDEARAGQGEPPRGLLGAWCALVGAGSAAAVRVCRHV